MKVLLVAAVLLAQAVVPPISRGFPAPQSAGPNDGITVSGSGTAAADATYAQVSVTVNSGRTMMTRSTLQPLVDAITRAGGTNVVLPVYAATSAQFNGAAISFTVQHPSVTELQSGIATVGAAVVQMGNVNLSNAQVSLHLTDCAPVLEEAQRKALSAARADAAALASEIGARLGPAQSIDARGYAPAQDGDCQTTFSIGPYTPAPASPSDYVRVKVNANVVVRYAIVR